MGIAWSVEEQVGRLCQKMLMPQEAPAWFAGSGGRSFPKAPDGSLLLLSHISLAAPSDAGLASSNAGLASLRQFAEAVRMLEVPKEQMTEGDLIGLQVGPSQLRFRKEEGLADFWPGHFYIWLGDCRKAFDGCKVLEKALGQEIVKEVQHVKSGDSADVLVVQDPSGAFQLLANEAPRGRLLENMRVMAGGAERAPSNAVALIDATHSVAPGKSAAIARFYRHFLGAPVSFKPGSCSVLFAFGSHLRQTLTFLEDPSATLVDPAALNHTPVPSVCLYLPSREAFQQTFERSEKANILDSSGATTWGAAESSLEFRIRSCVDPRTGGVVLELLHILRLREHPEWPVHEAAPAPEEV